MSEVSEKELKFNDYKECILCAGRSRILVSKISRNFLPLDTVICTGCGLVHNNPIPSKGELDQYYEETYRRNYKLAIRPKLKHVLRYAPGALARVALVRQYLGGGAHRVLDVGSGSGEFLYMASKAGFETLGIEPHKGYSEYCMKELNLNVQNATLEMADINEGYFDLINLNHVLEHMRNPLDTLKRIRGYLRQGGIMLLDVPDVALDIHAPWTKFHFAHIYNFNHITLKALADKAGYEILNPETSSTNLVLRKADGKIDICDDVLKRNFEDIFNRMKNHSASSHYGSKTPYKRFLKKCIQYPMEFFYVSILRSPRKILDDVFYRNRKYLANGKFMKDVAR